MIIAPEKLKNIDQAFLESLINNGIEENLHLDYKQKFGSNAEIAKDISSFANSSGGYIIYGIKEVGHKPAEIIPLSGTNTREKLDQISRNGIDPSLEVRIHPVDVSIKGKTGQVFIVYIPKKYPFIRQAIKRGKYYKKTEFTSSPMSHDEIKTAFDLIYQYDKRIDVSYQNRLHELNEGQYQMNILEGAKIFIHFISIDSILQNKVLDLEPLYEDFDEHLNPLGCTINTEIERNAEGLIVSCGPEYYTKEYVGYVQLYRNGMMEIVDSYSLKPTTQLYGIRYKNPVKILGVWNLEKSIIKSCHMYLNSLNKIGVDLPIYLYISYKNLRDIKSL